MKKKKVVKKVKTARVKRTGSPKLFYGLEHEFVIIVGGGFLVIVFGMFFLFMR
jgi:hypothetical protein